ncbi:MAG: hypothetical protein ACOCP8_00010 [archaeon]
MKYTKLFFMILLVNLLIIPTFAKDNDPNEELPDKLTAPESTSLRDEYEIALEGLKESGWGVNNYPNGISGSLSIPKKSAEDVFKDVYGDYTPSFNTNHVNKGLANKPSKGDIKERHSIMKDEYQAGASILDSSFESVALELNTKWDVLTNKESKGHLLTDEEMQNILNNADRPDDYNEYYDKNSVRSVSKLEGRLDDFKEFNDRTLDYGLMEDLDTAKDLINTPYTFMELSGNYFLTQCEDATGTDYYNEYARRDTETQEILLNEYREITGEDFNVDSGYEEKLGGFLKDNFHELSEKYPEDFPPAEVKDFSLSGYWDEISELWSW